MNQFYYFISVFGVYTDWDGVYAAEELEEQCLALHNGHGCLRPYVSQAQNPRPVTNDGYKITLICELVCRIFVLKNLSTNGGHPWGIVIGQVLMTLKWHLADDLYLSLIGLMEL